MSLPATEEAKLLNWGLAAVSPLFFILLVQVLDFLIWEDPGFASLQVICVDLDCFQRRALGMYT